MKDTKYHHTDKQEWKRTGEGCLHPSFSPKDDTFEVSLLLASICIANNPGVQTDSFWIKTIWQMW